MAADLALKLIYADYFGPENYKFFKDHVDITVGSWINDLRRLIDEECNRDITLELNNKEKIIHVLLYLKRQDDISKYENFINIWKKHDPARASQFELALRHKIRNQGLAYTQNEETKDVEKNAEFNNDVEMVSDKGTNSVEMLSDPRSSMDISNENILPHHLPIANIPSHEGTLQYDVKHLLDLQYWKKGRMLGKGISSEVFQFEHLSSRQQIAAKTVKFDPNEGAKAIKAMHMLKNEIRNLQSLHHDRIIKYFGYYEDKADFVTYLCLEYMARGSIRSCLDSGERLDNKTVKRFTRQILEGIIYLHGKSIVHRDVKGANILIDDKNDIKLADFGLSKELTSLTHGGRTEGVGTYRWMAPEVAKGEDHGVAADIWSVGCTVVEMITTKAPWPDKTKTAVIIALSNKDYPTYELPESDKDAEEFLRQCFVANHRNRPSAEQLLKANYCMAM